MDHFEYHEGELHAESVPVREIIAAVGSPCYIYSRATLERHWHAFDAALGEHPHTVCYAVKANANLGVLQVLAKLGSGFDVVSVGELDRVLAAGGLPQHIVFSGVGKQVAELQRALSVGIGCFNVESQQELALLNTLAGEMGCIAPVSLRINPNIDAKTHPYIATGLHGSKFGIESAQALALYRQAAAYPHLKMVGIDCHIGSQLTEIAPFLEAVDHVMEMVAILRSEGLELTHVDFGGGLGVRYQQEQPPHPYDLAAAIVERVDPQYRILLEPGRAIAANAGILVSEVLEIKQRDHRAFAIVDAGMNDLLRPALYNAWHDIIPVKPRTDVMPAAMDVVGPVCETGDFLGRDRNLALARGDLIAVRGAGAYGFAMSSQYNSRPRCPEVMVTGSTFTIVRRRETVADLMALESLVE